MHLVPTPNIYTCISKRQWKTCVPTSEWYLPDLKPGKELRATLCEPLHRRRLHALVEKATGGDQQRLA